jgi:hypothetical protein
MKIIKIINSPVKNKRFRVYLDDNTYYDFGLKDPKFGTYIDHHDKEKRENYRRRHLGNKIERERITTYSPSPSLFSYYLLWGDNTSLKDNIKMLNNILSRL